MKLNLGSGRTPLPGYVNVDVVPGPGVDVVQDLDVAPWPWPDASVDEIVASHVLEHVLRFDVVWSEIRRILRVGGRIHIRVPYGVNFDPYHIRYFDRSSIDRLTTSESCCAQDHPGTFLEVGRSTTRIRVPGFPAWHLKRYLSLNVRLPWGQRELLFTLEKVG
jgi:SAM-dependent methyltransferase